MTSGKFGYVTCRIIIIERPSLAKQNRVDQMDQMIYDIYKSHNFPIISGWSKKGPDKVVELASMCIILRHGTWSSKKRNNRQERGRSVRRYYRSINLSLCFRVDDHMAVILKILSFFGADKETMIFWAIKHPLTAGLFLRTRSGFSCDEDVASRCQVPGGGPLRPM